MLERIWNSILELTAQFVIARLGRAHRAAAGPHRRHRRSSSSRWCLPAAVRGTAGPPRQAADRAAARRPASTCPGRRSRRPSPRSGVFLLLLGLVFGGLTPGPRRDRAGPDAALLAGRRRCASTTTTSARHAPTLPAVVHDGRRPASTCPGRRSGRSSARSGSCCCCSASSSAAGCCAAGVIALIATLVGWLSTPRKEYVKTVEADTTGHLENGPAPANAVAAAWRPGRS